LYGRQLAVMGRFAEAAAAFDEAERRRPDEPLIAISRGHSFALRGKYREAEAQYRKAVAQAKDPSEQKSALVNVGQMQERLGDAAGALASYHRASDQSFEALAAVAWMQAASPKRELRDPKAALEEIERTQPVDIFAAMVHDVHAVALAANGRFAEAVDANNRALQACRDSDAKKLPKIKDAIARLESRGDLYHRGQPYFGPTTDMTPVLDRE
jgi:tetratricopeptide (TPR) repeat protein